MKIKNMFDITKLDMSGLDRLYMGMGMGVSNKKIEKSELYNLLKEDGFLFPSRNSIKSN
jgi:hypothetical protein